MQKMTVENFRTDLEKAYAGPKMDYILSVLDATTIDSVCQEFSGKINAREMSKKSAMEVCFSRLSGEAEIYMWKNQYTYKEISDIVNVIISENPMVEKTLANGIAYNAIDITLAWNCHHTDTEIDPIIVFMAM